MTKILGISGVATSGKDTLCQLIIEYFKTKNIECKRLALADKLKEDLFPFIKEKFNINIFDPNAEEKRITRPILVSYGKAKRILSEGKHWTNLLEKNVRELQKENIVPIVTDIRYHEYPEDEYFWLKKLNGILVHISRYDTIGSIIKPANIEEETNDLEIKRIADIKYNWQTESKLCVLFEKHKGVLEEIYEKFKI
jgi:dephospho-CoA kinase